MKSRKDKRKWMNISNGYGIRCGIRCGIRRGNIYDDM